MSSVGRSYVILGSSGGVLAPIIPVPAGLVASKILKARVAMSTVAGGSGESFTLALDSTTIATATMGATAAVADFVLSSTSADANSKITSGTTIAAGALTFNIPQLAGNYYVVLDIEWDDSVAPLT